VTHVQARALKNRDEGVWEPSAENMGCRGEKKYGDEKLHIKQYHNFILAWRMVQSSGIKVQNIQNGRQRRNHVTWKTE
jgi:hypothetical protein